VCIQELAERIQKLESGEVQPLADPPPAEQHDPEEPGLEEEGRQHLVGQQRAQDGAGHVAEPAPVGAELVAHDHARDDAHAEGHGEDAHPEAVEVAIDVPPGLQPQRLQHREIAGEADGEGREEDVEGDREGELDAGQVERFGCRHPSLLCTGRATWTKHAARAAWQQSEIGPGPCRSDETAQRLGIGWVEVSKHARRLRVLRV
jgi:hypothetical protein